MQLSDRIGKRIKLQDVHILMTVVQAGSMGKAARHLNTSQPNISKSIADLERSLGVRLLDRHRNGTEPTEYGRALLEGGIAVFDELRLAVKNIEYLSDPEAGEVRIGCTPWLAAGFASAIIDRLCRRYPRIKFQLMTRYADGLHQGLHDRSFDLLIAWKFGPIADERLGFESLFDDRCVVVASAQNSWVRRRRPALAELANEPWVLPPPGSGITSIAMKAFGARGLNPRTTVVTDSPQVRMSLLATGRFLTILPTSTLKVSTKSLNLKTVSVELPMARIPNGIVTLKNRTLSPVARLVIDTAREVARPWAK